MQGPLKYSIGSLQYPGMYHMCQVYNIPTPVSKHSKSRFLAFSKHFLPELAKSHNYCSAQMSACIKHLTITLPEEKTLQHVSSQLAIELYWVKEYLTILLALDACLSKSRDHSDVTGFWIMAWSYHVTYKSELRASRNVIASHWWPLFCFFHLFQSADFILD